MKNRPLPFYDLNSASGGDEFDFHSWSASVHSKTLVSEGIERIDQLYTRKEYMTGLPTGLERIDLTTRGLHNGDLIIIGARPSTGKTALATSIVENVAVEQKSGVAIFTQETSRYHMMQRLLTSRSRIDVHKVSTGFLSPSEWLRLNKAAAEISGADIFIDDTSSISIGELREKTLWLKHNCGIKLAVVDNFQMLYEFIKAGKRPKGVEKVSRALKFLAIELDIPVIVVSQLSRSVEARAGHRPCLTDLPGAGATAHSADVILLLTHEEYYSPNEENRGVAEVIVAKNHYGPVTSADLSFKREYARFEDLPQEWQGAQDSI